MSKVYIVTSGEYSEYYIDAVFSTRKKAEEFVDYNGPSFEIEEYEMDVPFEKSVKLWKVTLDFNNFNMVYCDRHRQQPPYVEAVQYITDRSNNMEMIDIIVKSDTVTGAVKSASEKLTQVKALMEIKFPQLKKKIVSLYRSIYYPIYNYRTGAIILYPDWRLSPGIEVPTEVRETSV